MDDDRQDRLLDIGSIDAARAIAPQVHRLLRRAILTLALQPGRALSEKDIAAHLSISRTPVREAMIRLAEEGLVDILPQRGTFVAPIRRDEIEEAQFVREAIEVAAVRRLAARIDATGLGRLRAMIEVQERTVTAGHPAAFMEADDAFHAAIFNLGGVSLGWTAIGPVKLRMDRLRHLSLPDPVHLERLVGQHRAIVEALAAGDPDRAAGAMAMHLREVLRSAETLADVTASGTGTEG